MSAIPTTADNDMKVFGVTRTLRLSISNDKSPPVNSETAVVVDDDVAL